MKDINTLILCCDYNNKAFPYISRHHKSCLPVANEPLIKKIVQEITGTVHIASSYFSEQLKFALRSYGNISFCDIKEEDIPRKIYELGKEKGLLVVNGNSWIDPRDIETFFNNLEPNTVLFSDYASKSESLDKIGALIENDTIKSFFGHARGSYTNVQCSGWFYLSSNTAKNISNARYGFHSTPVGGNPPYRFFLEQFLQDQLQDGVSFKIVKTQFPSFTITYPWDLFALNRHLCKLLTEEIKETTVGKNSTIDKNADIRGYVTLGKNSKIGPRVLIEGNCVIGDNTVIENGAMIGKNCIIGNNCIIKDYARIHSETVIGSFNKISHTAEVNGLTFDNVAAVHTCELYGIIGSNVDIGAGTLHGSLRFDDQHVKQYIDSKCYSNEFTNIVCIGDNVRTGIGTLFYPGIKIGAGSVIGPGVVVAEDVPPDTMLLLEQNQEKKTWSPSKFGW